MRFYKLTSFYLILLALFSTALGEKATRPKEQLKFAAFLNAMGEYERAASEYEKYLFFNNHESDSIRFLMGYNYLLAKCYEKSRRAFQSIMVMPKSTYCMEAKSYSAFIDFKNQDYSRSISQLEARTSCASFEQDTKSRILHAADFLLLKKFDQAEAVIPHAVLSHETASAKNNILSLLKASRNFAYKYPTKAAIFSAVIPGSGKIYAGRSIDGLFSFILIGGTSYLAYDGFQNDRNVKAWLFTGITSIFYIGNIYGSFINARLYNSQRFAEIRAGVNFEIDKLFISR